jgi:hypothetical protein
MPEAEGTAATMTLRASKWVCGLGLSAVVRSWRRWKTTTDLTAAAAAAVAALLRATNNDSWLLLRDVRFLVE